MSLLAADVGNSHTVLGLLEDGEVLAHWRVGTGESRTADEWAVLLRGLLAEQDRRVGGIALCATVPTVLHEWRDMVRRHFPGVPHVIVEPGVRTGLPVLTDNPREVGSDRIMNALAAARIFGGPAIVVDFGGTATTFDVVNSSGHYVGGVIAPGLGIGADALGQRGAQLREVELVRPRTVVARNTVEAVQSGMIFGTAAQVDGLVARMAAELGLTADRLAVISTGYLAGVVVGECACFTDHAPWLTLQGLEMAFVRNSPA